MKLIILAALFILPLVAAAKMEKDRKPASGENCKELAVQLANFIDKLYGDGERPFQVTGIKGKRDSYEYEVTTKAPPAGRGFAANSYLIRFDLDPEYGSCVFRSIN